MVSKELREYIENNILPSYVKNDSGHNIDHINYVIKRSLKFAKEVPNINIDMVYTIAAYHDIGHYIDAKNHEKISGDMLYQDDNLRKFFTEEEMITMRDAVYDHRASSSAIPRTIYGKIVSSADRNTSIESTLKRTYAYRLKHNPEYSLDEIIEKSRKHVIDKFGINGYAREKMFFQDDDYEHYLDEITKLADDKEAFRERFLLVNGIE